MARRSLRSARVLLDDDDPQGAANRAFYAMFHAATAALVVRGERVATHAGLIGRFSDLFIKPGEFPKELGRAFNLAEDRRMEADYTGVTMPQESSPR